MRYAAILGQVGIVIAAPIALGAWLGLKIDEALGSEPWGLLATIFAGTIAAGAGVWGLIVRFEKEDPIRPSTDRAREAGRRWDAEIRERERRRESGQDEE